jgi:hypothetical protein
LKLRWLIPAMALLSLPVFAQSTPATIYAESFRHGATRIIEDKFNLTLTPQDRTFSEHIKDSSGADRYLFSILPIGPNGDVTITAWNVKLADLKHRYYRNLLLTSLQEDATDNPRNQLWQLNPSNFASLPVKAKRIIKVEGFYLVLQVKSYHFTPLDSPYLDSMTISVELTNTDPRTATDVPK